ncbi:TIR domain-containing protein [Methanocella conradii]|uniref:TIR domain-containing protein n=1 Tax=Methanocella conradii TaxID=1175444 RepID=UPI0024B3BAF7|nr:TIR domain-containing protein [Methanocella conradii]MDI6896827.1 TIR domain-containing protein [Methanocella conradii]
MLSNENRDHLFISYASEDSDLATWLTLKLTSEGYSVWCDKFKLLGGESYPKDIDKAIKEQTFRVIALMSRNSNNKPNPLKERTLALNIARERKEDFIIPVNVDGIKPPEINWMMNDLTFIPFYDSWAKGLSALLKKLSEINAPRPIINDGKAIAASAYYFENFTNNEKEVVSTNILPFLELPRSIIMYKIKHNIPRYKDIFKEWAFYIKDNSSVFAFHPPPDKVDLVYNVCEVRRFDWRANEFIEGIKSTNIVSNLLYKSLNIKMFQRGLKVTNDGVIYFPKNLLQNDNIIFNSYDGKKTRIKVVGERSFYSATKGPSKYYYHLAPTFMVRQDIDGTFVAQLSIHLYLTDENFVELPSRSLTSRNKKVRKSWQNHHWYLRHIAIAKFLSDDSENIIIGSERSQMIVLSSDYIKATAPYGINEDKIAADADDNREIWLKDDIDDDDRSEEEEDY